MSHKCVGLCGYKLELLIWTHGSRPDSRVQFHFRGLVKLARALLVGEENWTRESRGTHKSKKGESTSPQSLTPSSSSINSEIARDVNLSVMHTYGLWINYASL